VVPIADFGEQFFYKTVARAVGANPGSFSLFRLFSHLPQSNNLNAIMTLPDPCFAKL
jgi:hypothetical protein